MPTLFVDCANTLITLKRVFNQHGEEAWEPNWDVVAAIERWLTQDLGEVVVWSEKGAADAERWVRRVIPQLAVACRFKDIAAIRPGDAAIDDVRLSAAGVDYRPAQSFMVAPAP